MRKKKPSIYDPKVPAENTVKITHQRLEEILNEDMTTLVCDDYVKKMLHDLLLEVSGLLTENRRLEYELKALSHSQFKK